MADARGYGDLKAAVAEAVKDLLAPVRERYEELRPDEAAIEETLAAGADKARAIARGDPRRRARGDGPRSAPQGLIFNGRDPAGAGPRLPILWASVQS